MNGFQTLLSDSTCAATPWRSELVWCREGSGNSGGDRCGCGGCGGVAAAAGDFGDGGDNTASAADLFGGDGDACGGGGIRRSERAGVRVRAGGEERALSG